MDADLQTVWDIREHLVTPILCYINDRMLLFKLAQASPLLSSLGTFLALNLLQELPPSTSYTPLMNGVGSPDALLDLGVGDASRAWPNMFSVPYTRHVHTLSYAPPTTTTMPTGSLHFVIDQCVELITFLTLKVPRCVSNFDDNLGLVEFRIGGELLSSFTMAQNVAMAKHAGMWPKRTNREGRVITIPLVMLGNVLPVSTNDLKYHLITLDIATSSCSATTDLLNIKLCIDSEKVLSYHQLPNILDRNAHLSGVTPGLSCVHSSYLCKRETVFPECGRADLVVNWPAVYVSGFIMHLKEFKPLPSTFSPIISASLIIGGHLYMFYDLSDMAEYNWLRSGVHAAPSNNLELLFPFSVNDMLGKSTSKSCLINLRRAENVIIRLCTDPSLDGNPLKIDVSIMNFNIKLIRSGMLGMLFH